MFWINVPAVTPVAFAVPGTIAAPMANKAKVLGPTRLSRWFFMPPAYRELVNKAQNSAGKFELITKMSVSIWIERKLTKRRCFVRLQSIVFGSAK